MNVKDDIGLVYSMIDGTTATIVSRFLTKAKNDVLDLTGTTTGRSQDRAILAIADCYAVTSGLSRLDPNKDNIEGLLRMKDEFAKRADSALRRLGRSFDGIRIQFVKVNP